MVDYACFCHVLQRHLTKLRGIFVSTKKSREVTDRKLRENIGKILPVIHSNIHTTISTVSLSSYQPTCLQELREAFFPARVDYCKWLLDTFDELLLQKTFLTEKTWFHFQ